MSKINKQKLRLTMHQQLHTLITEFAEEICLEVSIQDNKIIAVSQISNAPAQISSSEIIVIDKINRNKDAKSAKPVPQSRRKTSSPASHTNLISRRDAAKLIGVSKYTITQWVNAKILPPYDCKFGHGSEAYWNRESVISRIHALLEFRKLKPSGNTRMQFLSMVECFNK